LLVAGGQYYTVGGPLPTTRETEASPNDDVVSLLAAGAKTEQVRG
jgi:hypothetical protein